ncbi:MAG: hypothetical protein FJ319_08700 [SAR202 cluster bacterium]|nr:hypothetical protein [SAR202 cluster bacterium]
MPRLILLLAALVFCSLAAIACDKDFDPLNLPKGSACADKGEECARPTPGPDEEFTPPAPENLGSYDSINLFVTDLTVIHGVSANINCPIGYTKRIEDLNADAGGDWVFLCLKFDPLNKVNKPLSYLTVIENRDNVGEWGDLICGNNQNRSPDAGMWMKAVTVDLNEDAGGPYLYFCYGYDIWPGQYALWGQWKRIKDIQLVLWDNDPSGWPCEPRYTPVITEHLDPANMGERPLKGWSGIKEFGRPDNWIDLNKGAGGKWVYGCIYYG